MLTYMRLYIIPVKKVCNASCSFCYMKEKPVTNLPEFIDINKLKIVLLSITDNIDEVEITGGGEPTLHKNIIEIVDLIRDIFPKTYIKMYSNGIILKKFNNLNELNLSRIHYNTDLNNKTMCIKVKNNELIDILTFYRPIVDKIRIQTILYKNLIDSSEKALEYINKYESLVDVFMFRTLFPKCSLDKQNYVHYFEINHPKVKIDKTLDNYDRKLLFINSNCDIFDTFQY